MTTDTAADTLDPAATGGVPADSSTDRRPAMQRARRRAALHGWLFIGPLVLGILAFQAAPVFVSLFTSFTNWDGVTTPKILGLANYRRMFAADPQFWVTLRNTAVFVVGVIPLTVVVALLLAVLCNGRGRIWNGIFRTAYFTPYVTSIVAIGLVWTQFFTPSGVLNQGLKIFGISGPSWLTDVHWAMPAVILVSAWQAIGYPMVILIAGLQAIPESLLEAARVDGANAAQRFFRVTLPLLTPQLFFVLITQIISSFQVFALIFVMTKGGPGTATNVYIYQLYQNAFTFGDLGYASAMAWFLFLIIGLITFVQWRLQRRWVFYND
ncbi:carbohydrate ABC transporter permease [Microlunatus soli]|uniref:Carbohydrate ABC transporter membrane protein 1, CUT1 family n=1 Tax=Microlunatus soli TaxID=630515 RepID=A0A1H1QKM3_9ACTN|nr:sugar ABC transporter permease [Microlunatus soli]SDS23883.1 carbohydrate ABC transporter membrane protein 1, CUT1 family [Microlunatus soli]